MFTLTVSQLNRYVKAILDENEKLRDIYIKAEISNFTNHYRSGHFYFSLKDEKASVKAVMFSSYAEHVRFLPEEGMAVLVRASVSLYEVDGSYQLYVTDMQPFGVGGVEVALRQLRERLEAKGYFLPEHKKPLPKFPSVIGVITSTTGAAIGDIQQVLSRRYPLCTMRFCPAIVQGKGASLSLIAALKTLDNHCDVILIGRGGGSKEDLWAFNDEELAKAIYFATTPVVSAVGHEMDTTICDLVADHRAATPSAAAEMVSPSVEQLGEWLGQSQVQLGALAGRQFKNLHEYLCRLAKDPVLLSPYELTEKKQKKLDFAAKTMYTIQRTYFSQKLVQLQEKALLLESLSPFAVLGRGYAVVFKEEQAVRSVAELEDEDLVTLRLQDGTVDAMIKQRYSESGI